MRHRKSKLQFNRRTAWRAATIKSLAQVLFTHGSIRTTLTRAKATQPVVEKLISWGKTNTLEKKRLAFSVLGEHSLVKALFADIAPRFASRASGFTRILRLENRRGDDAQIVIFQLTELPEKEKAQKHRKKGKEPKETAAAQTATEKPHEQAKPHEPSKPGEEKPKPEPQAEKTAAPEAKAPKKGIKPQKKFLGGIRGIFKKERDSL